MGKLQEVFEPIVDKPVAFIVKGSPDPDAIAGSLALLSFYESLTGSGKIYYNSYISHSNNKARVNVLGINMEKIDSFAELDGKYEHYIVVDHSDPKVEGLDISKCILHVDHHKEAESDKKNKGKEKDLTYTKIVELDAGSCSSILTKLLQDEGFFESGNPDVQKVASALTYGVRSDTDNLDSAGPKDWEAMKLLSQYASKVDVKKMTAAKITAQTADLLKRALSSEKEEQGWLYTGVGFLQETYRDSIATVADELQRRSGIDHVLVYAIIEKDDGLVVEGSVRSSDAGMDLDAFVRSFSENAGGRKHKAGFAIPLEFWGTCPDKDQLANLVATTIENKFKSILSTERG